MTLDPPHGPPVLKCRRRVDLSDAANGADYEAPSLCSCPTQGFRASTTSY